MKKKQKKKYSYITPSGLLAKAGADIECMNCPTRMTKQDEKCPNCEEPNDEYKKKTSWNDANIINYKL